MGSNGPLFQALLTAHVLAAVIGFGAILVSGGYATAVRAGASKPGGEGGGPESLPASVRRYFRPGRNWAARCIYLVPVLGLALAGVRGKATFGQAWLWLGSALWLLAAGLATGVIWPAEARLASIAQGGSGLAQGGSGVARTARLISGAVAVVDVCFLAAIVVMIAQPGA